MSIRDSYKTMAELAYSTLKERILNGELNPGQRIDQDAEAASLEASRMPIREALRRLESDGLVEITKHRGVYVKPMSVEDLDELYVLRVALEPIAARRGAENITPDGVQILRDLIPPMQVAVLQVDVDAWIELDWMFHSTIYAASQLPRLISTIQSLHDEVERYRRLKLVFQEELELSMREHQQLIDACTTTQGEEAERIIRTALERSQRTLPEFLRSASSDDRQ